MPDLPEPAFRPPGEEELVRMESRITIPQMRAASRMAEILQECAIRLRRRWASADRVQGGGPMSGCGRWFDHLRAR